MYFIEWSNEKINLYSSDSIGDMEALFRVMAVCQPGDRPLP